MSFLVKNLKIWSLMAFLAKKLENLAKNCEILTKIKYIYTNLIQKSP